MTMTLLYSSTSVLTVHVRSQEHSVMMISRDLREKQDRHVTYRMLHRL